jgi:hypothetical protein
MKLSCTKLSNLILQVLSSHSTHTPILHFSLLPSEHTTYRSCIYPHSALNLYLFIDVGMSQNGRMTCE